MNKYFIILIILILIIVAGVGYSAYFVSDADKPMSTGRVREITVTARENQWTFDPEEIEVDQGDRVILTVVNQDSYDHGFAIDAYGITQRMPAGESIRVEFVATKAGDFPYYCSVPCGSGEVDGVSRGHFDQIGRLHVRSLINETVDYKQENKSQTTKQNVDNNLLNNKVDTVIEARLASLLGIANAKAQELGFDTTRIKGILDNENMRWLTYSRSLGNVYANDEAMSFLSDPDNFFTVYYNPSGHRDSADIWVFISKHSGDILGYIVGQE